MTGRTRNGVSSRLRSGAILRSRVEVPVRRAAMPCPALHSRQRQVAACCNPSTWRQAQSTRIRSARCSFTASPSACLRRVQRYRRATPATSRTSWVAQMAAGRTHVASPHSVLTRLPMPASSPVKSSRRMRPTSEGRSTSQRWPGSLRGLAPLILQKSIAVISSDFSGVIHWFDD